MAAKARPGNFVIVMADERGERIPLTIADYDAAAGTVTLVLMVVGTTSRKVASLSTGDELYALIGPLGRPSEISDYSTVVMVAGGVGTAPVYPIAKAFTSRGTRVISIQGRQARGPALLAGPAGSGERRAHCHDRRRFGRSQGPGHRTAQEVLEEPGGKEIGCVYAIGPVDHDEVLLPRPPGRSASRRSSA